MILNDPCLMRFDFAGWVCVLQVECSDFSNLQGQPKLALVCFVESEGTYITQLLSHILIAQIICCKVR